MEQLNKFKAKAMQETERMIAASEESLAKYNEGYKEGYSDGYDKALEDVQGIIRKYNLGGEKSNLKPVAKGIRPKNFNGQIEKLKEELAEVIEAYLEGQGKERIAEELVDLQLAAETGLAMLNLSESERQNKRKKGLCKNASRGYYND